MDSLLHFLFILLSTLLILLFSIYLYQLRGESRGCTVPQAGGAWPIVGHMPLFSGQQLRHRVLAAMADKYGPVFTIKLGWHRVLIMSSWEMAKECFTVNDRVFSTRPSIAASKLLGYNFAMFGFAPYGPYWSKMRKITTMELLSSHRIDLLRNLRASEVETAIKDLYQSWVRQGREGSGVVVDMKQWFGDLTLNVAVRMVGGKRYFGASASCEEAEARRTQKVMRDFMLLISTVVLSDAIPFLGSLDFCGNLRAMKRIAKELDILVGGWLEEHKKKRKLLGGEKKEEQDFMDVLLNILENSNIPDFDADTINKATCLNLVLAGSDTTMVTLTWALSLLLNHPLVLKKAQEELGHHVSMVRRVEESDIANLPYLQAIIKETLRLYPPSPLIALRASIEDCTLSAGYHVPEGTHLMVNAWKIQRDGRTWPNPDAFQPERFLTSHKDRDFKGQNFEFIPFGSGRRSCSGMAFKSNVLFCYLGQGCDNGAKILNKPSVKACKTVEALYVANALWCRPIPNCLDLVFIHYDTIHTYNIAKKKYPIQAKGTLRYFTIQFLTSKGFKY